MTLLVACCLSGSTALAAAPDVAIDVDPGVWVTHRAADIDDDGVRDLLLGSEGNLLVWFGSLGVGPVGPRTTYPMATGGFVDLVAGDFDGDGIDDVLASTLVGGTRTLSALRGEAGGPVAVAWGLPASFRRAQALGDVDGDGHSDVLIDGTVWNGSPSGPVAGASILAEAPQRLWALGDVDGDGYDDVALQGTPSSEDWYGGVEAELVFLGGGADGLDATPRWAYGRPDRDCGFEITLVDVDLDGVGELIVTCITTHDSSGSGVLDVLDDITTTSPVLLTSTPFSLDIGNGFDLATLDDWDDDGVDEVVLGLSDRVVELPWHADDGLEIDIHRETAWSMPGVAVTSVSTVDMSGDGRGDLTVSWYDHTDDTRSATVWLGPGGELLFPGIDPVPGMDGPSCGCAPVVPGGGGAVVVLVAALGLLARRERRL